MKSIPVCKPENDSNLVFPCDIKTYNPTELHGKTLKIYCATGDLYENENIITRIIVGVCQETEKAYVISEIKRSVK